MDFSFLKEAGVEEERGFTVCPASSFSAWSTTSPLPVIVTEVRGEDSLGVVRRELLRRYDGAAPVWLWCPKTREMRREHAAALAFPQREREVMLVICPEECLAASASAASLQRLRRVMEALRAPDGCPWDRAQTHETLRTYLLQEAYEVVDAIDRGDRENLKEELGDVLYQVVFHARLAEERGEFTLDDVADGIADKMIERHPYVFSTMTAEETAELLGSWEIRKMREKRRRRLLEGLSVSLPSLLFACIMQKKVSSICREKAAGAEDRRGRFESSWRKAMDMAETGSAPDELERCFGKALFEMVDLMRAFGMEPELALHRFNSLFSEQFGEWEESLRKEGRTVMEAGPEDLSKLEDRLEKKGLL